MGLSEKGTQEAIDGGREMSKARLRLRRRFHLGVEARHQDALAGARGDGPDVDSGAQFLAAQRAPLRRAAGLNKAQTAEKYGEQQVKIWRRSYDIRPPALTPDDERFPGKDPRYAGLKPEELPLTECLKDTVARTLPYWHETIAPTVRSGKRVIVAAHGNSLRGLVKYLDNVSDQDIVGLNIPTGIPLVYELDDQLKPLRHYYLGDPEAVAKAAQAVADQAKRKS